MCILTTTPVLWEARFQTYQLRTSSSVTWERWNKKVSLSGKTNRGDHLLRQRCCVFGRQFQNQIKSVSAVMGSIPDLTGPRQDGVLLAAKMECTEIQNHCCSGKSGSFQAKPSANRLSLQPKAPPSASVAVYHFSGCCVRLPQAIVL